MSFYRELFGVLVISHFACTAGVVETQRIAFEGAEAFRILSPMSNSAHEATHLNRWGELQTNVDLQVEWTGLDRVEVLFEGAPLATLLSSNVQSEISLPALGTIELEFVGYTNDVEIISQSRTLFINEPSNLSCTELLDLYNLKWEEAASSPGIEAPISLDLPLNGVDFRFVDVDTNRTRLYLDCRLALALARANPIFLKNNISTVVDIGIYNYRCIGGEGFPPDCPQGISAHANAQAIDIYALESNDGQTFSIEDDWVIDEENEETCEAETSSDADTLLHDVFCQQDSQNIWNTILTPNFNSAHRNHIHLDLKEGNDFTRSKDD